MRKNRDVRQKIYKEKYQMIKKKKLYRVYDYGELWDKKKIDFLNNIWCTDNFECRNMSMKDALKNSECISGSIIDESIKDCLIFTFFDVVNYPVKKDEFVEISYENLLEWCEEIEMVCCVGNDK
jgi:hypothetical protein